MGSARAAVTVTFAINGLLYGAWAARIPAVSDRLELSAGTLGRALACIAAGSLVFMPVAGLAAARWGSRRATRVALAAFIVASGTVALAPGAVALGAQGFVLGSSGGSLDVSMNAHGVTLERRLGRPVLSSLHAAFSLGGVGGAGRGARRAGGGRGERRARGGGGRRRARAPGGRVGALRRDRAAVDAAAAPGGRRRAPRPA